MKKFNEGDLIWTINYDCDDGTPDIEQATYSLLDDDQHIVKRYIYTWGYRDDCVFATKEEGIPTLIKWYEKRIEKDRETIKELEEELGG